MKEENMSALMNIEHVDFTYSDGSRALKNVTLDIYSVKSWRCLAPTAQESPHFF